MATWPTSGRRNPGTSSAGRQPATGAPAPGTAGTRTAGGRASTSSPWSSSGVADATVDVVLELLGAPDRLDDLVTALAELDEGGRRKVSTRVRSLAERIRWNDDG